MKKYRRNTFLLSTVLRRVLLAIALVSVSVLLVYPCFECYLQAQTVNPSHTNLPLSLLGTVVSNKKDNQAIILDESTQIQKLLHAGDTIHDAVIHKIERSRVVLLVNGQQQILEQKDRKGGGKGAGGAKKDVPLKLLPPNIMPPPPPPAPAPPAPSPMQP